MIPSNLLHVMKEMMWYLSRAFRPTHKNMKHISWLQVIVWIVQIAWALFLCYWLVKGIQTITL